jgi:ABC transporter, ATP-binding/permease protein
MIAHRLKTIKNTDQILAINEGHIQERGTHRELLEHNSLYARLWNLQNRSKEWSLG